MRVPKFRPEGSGKSRSSGRQAVEHNKDAGDRIRQALGDREVSWLVGKTGLGDSTIRDAIRRGPSRSDVSMKIAEALGLSLDWLLRGEERGDEPRRRGMKINEPSRTAEQLGLSMIPEIDISYSMGGGVVFENYVEMKLVPFRSDWLTRLTRGAAADVFLTRGQGDSMMPTLLDDDDVLVNRADRTIRHQDRIWALGYGDLGMIKRVRRLPNGLFRLNSDNPAVSPIEATEDEMYVVGRVIWIGRRV
jgi:phage repressor protein C with HTH and peptisase S24 domain